MDISLPLFFSLISCTSHTFKVLTSFSEFSSVFLDLFKCNCAFTIIFERDRVPKITIIPLIFDKLLKFMFMYHHSLQRAAQNRVENKATFVHQKGEQKSVNFSSSPFFPFAE